jgi:RNA polymerase sigma-70 factor (ECF subfamily)
MLLAAARGMDCEAIEKVFDLYAHALFKYAFRFCESALVADQVVGDVFSKLLEHLAAGRGPSGNLRSYLFEMTYHLLVDETRYSQRRVSIEAVETLLPGGAPTSLVIENRLMFETVLTAIKNDLTDYQRHVIVLRFLEGFSLYETGVILGKPARDIKAAQSRAIRNLRSALNEGMENGGWPRAYRKYLADYNSPAQVAEPE